MRSITALRFAGVKTSGIGYRAATCGDFDTALVFVGCRRVEPVVDAGPLRIARVEFVIVEFARVRATPGFLGEAPQHARPSAPGILVAVGMKTRKGISDGAPSAEEIGFRKLLKLRGKRAAKLAARAA